MTRYSLATSIFNRITGCILSLGLIVLIYWLMAVAGGTRAYVRAHEILSSGFFKLIYAGLIVAFCYHLVAGIRHLVWDAGFGFEKPWYDRSAWAVVIATVAATLLLWIVGLAVR